MSLELRILGRPGRDNALLVTVSTGQAQHRLLFDCGEGVLGELPVSWVQEIEAVFFSHFHIDHIAGFDSFFRLNWCRGADGAEARPSRAVRTAGRETPHATACSRSAWS